MQRHFQDEVAISCNKVLPYLYFLSFFITKYFQPDNNMNGSPRVDVLLFSK